MENKSKKRHTDLNRKLNSNLSEVLEKELEELNEIEVKSRAIYLLGQNLKEDQKTNLVQKEISKFFSEIFKDLTLSSHLCCYSLNNTSKVILRRVLEVGIAVLYLWDQPHIYLKLKDSDEHGSDLKFRDMVDHLNDSGYLKYISMETQKDIISVLPIKAVNRIYRELSNVIHGKEITFESITVSSFDVDFEYIKTNLSLTIEIENIILYAIECRFPNKIAVLKKEFPAFTKYSYGPK